MSYRYERYNVRPRRRSWLVTLVLLVWIVLLGLLAVRFLARPLLTSIIQERIAQRIRLPITDGRQSPNGNAALLPGSADSATITEDQANQWVESHRQELKGVDDVRLHFIPNEVQADVTIGGVTSTAHAGIEVSNGQVVIADPRLDAPLGLIVDAQPFADLLQQRLNSELATTGRKITGVTIGQGQIQIAVE